MINGKEWIYSHDTLIVWNEVICKYGSVKNLMGQGDYFKLADECERLAYQMKNLR